MAEFDEHTRSRIADTCHQVTARVDRIVPDVVMTIRTEIPEYALVPVAEHRQWVAHHLRELLTGLAERQSPAAEQVERARDLGRLRARQGLSSELLLGAYHICYRQAWNAVLERAAEQGTDGELVHVVNLVWDWIRTMTSAASEAYTETLRRSQVTQANLRYRFLDVLMTGDADQELGVTLAHALGYSPADRFQAVCTPAACWSDDSLERLQRRVTGLAGTVHCAVRGAVVVVLAQHADSKRLRTEAQSIVDAPVGFGLAREQLSGAAASIADAERALDLTGPTRSAVWFETDWLAASLARQSRRLAPLFSDAVDTARHAPHLAAAVLAYADNGLSVAGAARALHLHPNSVSYRLDRWRELTGWDTRSGDGLAGSLVALRVYS